MNKLIAALLLAIFPRLVLADNSLSFAPPASDYSMVFLGNLFGVVDGVLSGTGSQIMGSMFAVFNSAVLALGGIIIMYTLMVSTMNTAHEGQMLGQKWSSIWIPVRSTLGLALLIPKASGYCLMQIFIMWIVVQGVGAADKVWNAALSYLNRGGVIIQAQQINPSNDVLKGVAGADGVATGAFTILSGQVCMLGLQTKLQNQRQFYLDQQGKGTGPCVSAQKDSQMAKFCSTNVPDFIGSVNAVAAQNSGASGGSGVFSVTMPNFDSNSPYAFLNGTCGTLSWNSISSLANISNQTGPDNSPLYSGKAGPLGISVPTGNQVVNGMKTWVGIDTSDSNAPSNKDNNVSGNSSAIAGATGSTGTNTNINGVALTANELATVQMSRAIAIQQMYVDLASVAQTFINNLPDPSAPNAENNPPYNAVAKQPFGVPYTKSSEICRTYLTKDSAGAEVPNCYIWGPLDANASGVLFNGTEFINAMNDYNAVMMPTLNLLVQMNDASNASNARAFINNASTQGWIMAGAYFFDLVRIQGSSTMSASMTDSNTGLNNSTFDPSLMMASFSTNNGQACTGLCNLFQGNRDPVQQIQALIDGSILLAPNAADKPSLAASPNRTIYDGWKASTVYGFINNSLMVTTPGQPGIKPLTFANTINFSVDTSLYTLKQQNFSCGSVKILFFSFCLGQMMGNLFYNVIFLFIYNTLMLIFGQIINQVIMAFLMIPLSGMADIFKQGVQVLAEPGANPIVALANMGVQYINFSGNLWIVLLDMAVTSALIPVFGIFIFALIALSMPLLLAWVGVMTSIGFTTAYYIPILPYMIFTFGALSWLISVIEAMVAAPIVALGVTHPEGHDAFGKGEAAIMILINVFLRPSMMIIGYISAIALSYVGVWILNAGYDQAISFIQQQNTTAGGLNSNWGASDLPSGSGGYSDWAGIYAFFFSILTYTSMYLVLVQKSFTLISYLPDKVLRWIGGNPESLGQESASWAGDVQKQQDEGAKETRTGQGQIGKQLGGYGMKGLDKAKSALGQGGGGGSIEGMDGGSSTSDGGGGGDNEPPKKGKGGGGGGLGGGGLGGGGAEAAASTG